MLSSLNFLPGLVVIRSGTVVFFPGLLCDSPHPPPCGSLEGDALLYEPPVCRAKRRGGGGYSTPAQSSKSCGGQLWSPWRFPGVLSRKERASHGTDTLKYEIAPVQAYEQAGTEWRAMCTDLTSFLWHLPWGKTTVVGRVLFLLWLSTHTKMGWLEKH